MTANHLLSTSLFNELFQHNLISPDGRIIANDQQRRDYSTFLIKQSKERTAKLYAERKNLVNDVEDLVKLEDRTEEENKLLEELINELDLEFNEEGLLRLKKPRKSQKRYLGPKEPKKSIFERKIEAELERVKTLKRDLKNLDDWLEQISRFRPMSVQEEYPVDWKTAGIKYRQRTTNRMRDMENARAKLVQDHYIDYDQSLKCLLHRKMPKEKYLMRLPSPITRHTKETVLKDVRDEKGKVTKAQKSVASKIDATRKYKTKDEETVSTGQESIQDEAAAMYDGKDVVAYEQKALEDETDGKDDDKVEFGTSKGEKIIEEVITEEDNVEDETISAEGGAKDKFAEEDNAEGENERVSVEERAEDETTEAQNGFGTGVIKIWNILDEMIDEVIDNTEDKDEATEATEQDNTSGKRFETKVMGSPIDEDVITQVQLDAQKEKKKRWTFGRNK